MKIEMLHKNLQGMIEFYTMHRNAPLHENDLEILKAVLVELDKKLSS